MRAISKHAGKLGLAAICMAVTTAPAHAYDLYEKRGLDLDLDLTLGLGVFNSQKAYAQVRTEDSSPTWFEGYIKYGLSGEYVIPDGGTLFGAFTLITAANRGDGDAAGLSTGREDDTAIENAYIGWRSGGLAPWLGPDGIKVSVGRQFFKIGRGFLINGDLLDYGEGFDQVPGTPNGISRGGGTFYLAGRSTFDNTAIVSLGGDQGLRADAFWLKTENVGQAELEMGGGNLEFRDATYGTVGVTYLKGLDVDEEAARFFGYQHRDGQETWTIRGRTDLGIDKLTVAGQYVDQDNGHDKEEHAWYGELGWAFAEIPLAPSFTYRFSSFSRGYDPLFYGFKNFGTWYQGEVAGNYAGPYSSGTDIQHLGVTVQPVSELKLGALFFEFDNTANGALNARELDIYAAWSVSKHLTIYPLIGFYNPDKTASEGGTQIGDEDTNTYTQVFAVFTF